MKYRIFLSAFFLTLSPYLALAEYRVFVLKIEQQSANSQAAPSFRLVESTLDPEQYRMYYPVAANERITYIDTWRCYGRTDGFVPHCPNPKGQIPPATPPTP
ncbi:MAG: hypothetical protein AAGB31_10430 [Bdellovibrio sp.]